jgi:hypothetical protein
VDELIPIDKWFVGILAHANPHFRDALEKYLNSYRSLFQRVGNSARALAPFDINLILAEIGQALQRTGLWY